MCRFGLLWASLAIAGHGQTLQMVGQASPHSSYEETPQSPLGSLAALLLTSNTAAGWQIPQAGRCCNFVRDNARSNAVERHTKLHSLVGKSPVGSRGRLQHVLMEEAAAAKPEAESLQPLPPGFKPPVNYDEMLQQAEATVVRAVVDGKSRFVLRLLLPKGPDVLLPPDEGWVGGVMQLYGACSPVVRQLLRRVSRSLGGSEPKLTEQLLSDTEGVGVWNAQSKDPANDAVAMIQPMQERIKEVRQLDAVAGPRPLLLVNPQWKENLDPFDGLAAEGGLLGAVGKYFGGMKDRDQDLKEMGFEEIYTISQYVQRGSRVCLFKVYPYGWTAFYVDKETDSWKVLMPGLKQRPTGAEVSQAMEDQKIPYYVNEYTKLT
mmetsp:Transcript_69740/g.127448  ORF Transcript_69740/g.127448 Transcript_69740/m.127448 type:complete len:376 (-) Transcript_69740:141-1268(-)